MDQADWTRYVIIRVMQQFEQNRPDLVTVYIRDVTETMQIMEMEDRVSTGNSEKKTYIGAKLQKKATQNFRNKVSSSLMILESLQS